MLELKQIVNGILSFYKAAWLIPFVNEFDVNKLIYLQADSDKDGRLTLTEMIDNPYVFYSAIFNDEDEDSDYHDEFR